MDITLGFIAGITAGVCIGLLIAPEKGSETRRKIAESASDRIEKMKNLFKGGEENEELKQKATSDHHSYQIT